MWVCKGRDENQKLIIDRHVYSADMRNTWPVLSAHSCLCWLLFVPLLLCLLVYWRDHLWTPGSIEAIEAVFFVLLALSAVGVEPLSLAADQREMLKWRTSPCRLFVTSSDILLGESNREYHPSAPPLGKASLFEHYMPPGLGIFFRNSQKVQDEQFKPADNFDN